MLLFGPDRVKSKLREQGVTGKIVSEGHVAEREKSIKELQDYAERRRNSRAWERINTAIEAEDPVMLRKMKELEEMDML